MVNFIGAERRLRLRNRPVNSRQRSFIPSDMFSFLEIEGGNLKENVGGSRSSSVEVFGPRETKFDSTGTGRSPFEIKSCETEGSVAGYVNCAYH
jgi:hypothetical protein